MLLSAVFLLVLASCPNREFNSFVSSWNSEVKSLVVLANLSSASANTFPSLVNNLKAVEASPLKKSTPALRVFIKNKEVSAENFKTPARPCDIFWNPFVASPAPKREPTKAPKPLPISKNFLLQA